MFDNLAKAHKTFLFDTLARMTARHRRQVCFKFKD